MDRIERERIIDRPVNDRLILFCGALLSCGQIARVRQHLGIDGNYPTPGGPLDLFGRHTAIEEMPVQHDRWLQHMRPPDQIRVFSWVDKFWFRLVMMGMVRKIMLMHKNPTPRK